VILDIDNKSYLKIEEIYNIYYNYDIAIDQQFFYVSNELGDCLLCPYGC
jgi:hypothetical protein